MVYQLFQVPQSPLTGVRGFLSIDEDNKLAELATRFNFDGAEICNLGIEFGRSISILAKFAHFARVQGVELDPKEAYAPQMREANLAPIVIIGDVLEIGKTWKTPLDLLFVDDDHSLNHLRKEIPLWSQYVKVGGVMAFHDTAAPTNPSPHWLHIEVQQALTEWLEADGHNWKELDSADSIRVFERIGK